MKRRSSSSSFQFVAAAAASSSTKAAAMSSRRPYRGGGRYQWRREFSDRPSGGGGQGQFVTGDSHFQSVSDANRGFRPVEGANFANQSAFRPQLWPPFNPPPPFNSSPTFNHPPPFNQNQPFRPPQQFRPRPPKPLDYRNWEFANPGPPPHCERFTVLSYNILADYLAINHRSKLYFHIPRHMLDWEWRKNNIIFELGLWSADILCFQEVDRFQDLEERLNHRGYSGIWRRRTGDPVDGCAIFWRVSRFKLLHEECIEFNKLGLRDNVAQICVFESLSKNDNKDMSSLPLSLTGSNKVVICNIHVLFNPKRGEIKLGQIRVLLNRAHAVSKLWDNSPVVLCGDFNCTPKSPLYNYISEQKVNVVLCCLHVGSLLYSGNCNGQIDTTPLQLNLSDLPRDKLSGQASAEIHPPRQFHFNPNFRSQSADSTGGASAVVDHKEHGQKQNSTESNSVNLPFMNSLSQPQCVNINVFENYSFSGQCGNKNGASSYEITKETHKEVDGCKDETHLTESVPDGGLMKSSRSSQNKSEAFEQMKDGHEFTTLDSHCEDISFNLIETGLTKETRQAAVDDCKDEFYSTVSVSGLKESANNPQNEDRISGGQRKDGYEFTPVDSRHEDIYYNLIETERGKKLYATIDEQHDSFREQSLPNLRMENESMSCDKTKLSFLSANDSTGAIIDPMPSDASNSDIFSFELFREASFPSTLKVSAMGSSENLSSLSVADGEDIPSTLSKVNASYELTSIDYTIDEKMENLSLKECVETNEEGEDSTKFLSELHDKDCSFSSGFSRAVRSDFVESDKSFEESAAVPHSQQLHHPIDEALDDDSPGMDSEPVEALKFAYDPSAWTPMEIETATGNTDCTLVEHPLKLRSTYAEVEDCSGTRDSNGEPLVTSYNRCFLGTVDYIWCSEGLQTVRVLAPIPKNAMEWTPGFPTKKWGSDHIALVSELAFMDDPSIRQITEAP